MWYNYVYDNALWDYLYARPLRYTLGLFGGSLPCITNYYDIVDPLSLYPTLEQLSQLECDQWQLEILREAKINNIDVQWKNVVGALVNIGKYKLAESVCTQQGQ